ncbi:MAG: hypothetical protein R2716_00360 [Microthrixaceae bacterium]
MGLAQREVVPLFFGDDLTDEDALVELRSFGCGRRGGRTDDVLRRWGAPPLLDRSGRPRGGAGPARVHRRVRMTHPRGLHPGRSAHVRRVADVTKITHS